MEIDILHIDKNIREKWKMDEDKIREIEVKIEEINEIIKDTKLSIHIIKDFKNLKNFK